MHSNMFMYAYIYVYASVYIQVFGYHPELKKWTELGNSGMFRPEMLRPMGMYMLCI